MKKTLIASLSIILLFACKKEEVVSDKDELTGTSWIRFAIKSPVNNKDMYYYLDFKDDNKIDSYLKYNKIELESSTFKTLSFKRISSTKLLVLTTNPQPDTITIDKNTLTYVNSLKAKAYYTKQ